MINVQNEMLKRTLRPRLTPEEKEQQAKKMKLEEEKKIALKREIKPFITYSGKLFYHIELIDIALICDDLLTKVNVSKEITAIGFDLEWPFNFKDGPGKTAVIQISPDLHNCYVLQVSKLKNLPKSMAELLTHPNVRMTGNNVKNDVRKLARDFNGFNVEKMIENCVDVGVLANSVFPETAQRWSLERLVLAFLNMRINKDKKVRNSDWHKIPLTVAQQKYAAIDAYASLWLYQILKEKELEIQITQKNNEKENQSANVTEVRII